MKKFYFIIFIFFLNFTVSKSNEPFVVLEYKGDISNDGSSKINRNNKFIKEELIFKNEIGRVRDIEINEFGEVFLIADELDSNLFILRP